jgi:hypothetical protein
MSVSTAVIYEIVDTTTMEHELEPAQMDSGKENGLLVLTLMFVQMGLLEILLLVEPAEHKARSAPAVSGLLMAAVREKKNVSTDIQAKESVKLMAPQNPHQARWHYCVKRADGQIMVNV